MRGDKNNAITAEKNQQSRRSTGCVYSKSITKLVANCKGKLLPTQEAKLLDWTEQKPGDARIA